MHWTLHAARRVLSRGLDPAHVLQIASAGRDAGFGSNGQPARVRQGDTTVVIAGQYIITVYRRGGKRRRK